MSPAEIAIATASPADYDDHFLALRADANIDLHFVHGVEPSPPAKDRRPRRWPTSSCAACRSRACAGSRRCAGTSGPFEALPEGWLRVLPTDAPLSTPSAWNRLLARLTPEDWPDGADHTPALRACVELLAKGPDAAPEIGEAFLNGPGARDLAQGAARRPRRLDRRDAGDPEAG